MKNNKPRTDTDKHGQDDAAYGVLFQTQRGITFPALDPTKLATPDAPDAPDAPNAPGAPDSQAGFYVKPFRVISADTFPVYDANDYCIYVCEFLPDAIRTAAPLFESMPLQKDHKRSVDCNIGDVQNARFSDATPGIAAPGVDADFRINLKLDADTAERVKQGHIKCASAGIWFTFVKSHPDLDTWDFIRFQGQNINGAMVRRIITAITGVDEVSIVLAGADPNAKAIAEMSKIILQNNNPDTDNDRKEVNVFDITHIKKKLAEMSGVEIVTDQQLFDALNNINADLAEKNTLQTANAALTQQVAALQPYKTEVETRTAALRDSVKGLLQARAKGKAPSTLELKVIDGASLVELETMAADLKNEAMAAGHFRCPHCNAAITSLQSSVTPAPPAPEGEKAKPAASAPRTIHDHA